MDCHRKEHTFKLLFDILLLLRQLIHCYFILFWLVVFLIRYLQLRCIYCMLIQLARSRWYIFQGYVRILLDSAVGNFIQSSRMCVFALYREEKKRLPKKKVCVLRFSVPFLTDEWLWFSRKNGRKCKLLYCLFYCFFFFIKQHLSNGSRLS